MTLMSMKAIEEACLPTVSFRVHRSFIVHVDKIKTIERNRIVFGKVYIPVSDSYRNVSCSCCPPLVTVVTDKTAGICYLCKVEFKLFMQ